jgi:hypothetical protein
MNKYQVISSKGQYHTIEADGYYATNQTSSTIYNNEGLPTSEVISTYPSVKTEFYRDSQYKYGRRMKRTGYTRDSVATFWGEITVLKLN